MIPVMLRKIPMPTASVRVTSVRRKYPFNELEVGDWFFVPDRPKNNLSTQASITGKKLGKQFSTRLLYVLDDVEVDASTDGAVLGIGVWRVT